MNPVVDHIFSSLESDGRAIGRIFKNLRAQKQVNNQLILCVALLAVGLFKANYESQKRDARILDLEKQMAVKEEPTTKGE